MSGLQGDLTYVLAAVIVVIVVITLVINICIICRSGCWVCKKPPTFDLALPLTTFPTELPELPVDGLLTNPYSNTPPNATVLPRSQRSNLRNVLTVPSDGSVNRNLNEVNYYPAGMTELEDNENCGYDVIASNVNGQTVVDIVPHQTHQAITTDALKTALYASVLPRSQRLLLSKTTRKEPLNEEDDETENVPKTVVYDDVTNAGTNSTDKSYYMNTAEARASGTSTANPSSRQNLQNNTFPKQESRQHVDVVEPLYAEANEIDTRHVQSMRSHHLPRARGPTAAACSNNNDAGNPCANIL